MEKYKGKIDNEIFRIFLRGQSLTVDRKSPSTAVELKSLALVDVFLENLPALRQLAVASLPSSSVCESMVYELGQLIVKSFSQNVDKVLSSHRWLYLRSTNGCPAVLSR